MEAEDVRRNRKNESEIRLKLPCYVALTQEERLMRYDEQREKELLSKKERNLLKKTILKELTAIFDKKEGYAIYHGTNLEMVMQCVFDGLNKHTQKNEVELT